jgi:hypothetical protein
MSTRGRNLSVRKSTKTNPTSIETQVRGSLYDVQSQARRTNQVKGGFSNKLPSGLKEGDVLARFGPEGSIQLGVSDSRGDMRRIDIPPTFAQLPAGLSQYIDLQTGTVPPVLADFPNAGDFGQFYDSVTAALYWVRNIGGSLTFLNFLGFTGTITDTQHGNRGGGALHSAVTGAANGFMTAADKTKLDAATAAATPSTIMMRAVGGGTNIGGTAACADITASGTIDSTGLVNTAAEFRVDNTRVVTNRQTGWSAPTGTSTRTTFDTATVTLPQLAERFKALYEDLSSAAGHGLIN